MNTLKHREDGRAGNQQRTALKTDWKTEPLDMLCDIRNGSTPSKGNPAFWDRGTIPWFTIEDMREQGREISSTRQKITNSALSETNVKLLPVDSVLLCCTASVGEFAITRIPLTTNQQFNGLIVKNRNQLDPKFLFHYASTLKEKLLGMSGKTTIDFIPLSRLRDVAVPLPPLAEQQRIVAILDEAFADIATARANAVKNLENARALFESHLEAVFSNRGEGWVEKRLEEEVEFSAGYAFKSVNYVNEHNGIRLLRGDNIMQGIFRWDDAVYWPQDELLLFQRFNLEENDIVLAMDRPWVTAGLKIACVSKQDLPCLQVQRTARLRTSINLQWRYLFHLLRSKTFIDYLIEGQTGLGVPHISGKQILSFRFWLPPLADQTKVVTNLDALQSETNRLSDIYIQKIAALDALKKSLLHQAFSGAL